MIDFNLKDVIDKNSPAEEKRDENSSALMSSIHFVLCSWGPFLRIISRKVEMRFGLKQDFMNFQHQRFSPWIEFNVRWEHKMSGNSLSCYIPDKKKHFGQGFVCQP